MILGVFKKAENFNMVYCIYIVSSSTYFAPSYRLFFESHVWSFLEYLGIYSFCIRAEHLAFWGIEWQGEIYQLLLSFFALFCEQGMDGRGK